MKKVIVLIMALFSFFGLNGSKDNSDPATWSNKKIDKWFASREWSAGWTVTPDGSINKREFAVSYFKNKERWEKAFKFLLDNDLSKLELRRYDIDGNNLYALLSEYLTKNEETTKFEAHKKYIDIQYVITGKETMNIAPLSNVKEIVTQYDDNKDIEFMNVDKVTKYNATPSNFFIFFPSDAHRPGIREGESTTVRKIVIKLKID